jgi:hypothetical protein
MLNRVVHRRSIFTSAGVPGKKLIIVVEVLTVFISHAF